MLRNIDNQIVCVKGSVKYHILDPVSTGITTAYDTYASPLEKSTALVISGDVNNGPGSIIKVAHK